MNNIYIFDDIELLTQEVVAMMINSQKKSPAGKCNIAFSGGSTPKAIFEILKQNYSESIDWRNFSFYWVDERCVPKESPESNFGEAKRILFDHISTDLNLYPIDGENNPEKEANRYSEIINNSIGSYNNIPQFDIIFLGIGTDGHTASIFPYEMHLYNSEYICEVGTHPDTGQKRITITGKVITNAKDIVFFATGKDKQEVLKEVLFDLGDYESYPSHRVKTDRADCKWFLDEAAAEIFEE